MATYKHIRSNIDSKRPTTSLADGQIAINTNVASPGLFFKDSAGTALVKVGPVHVGTSAPNLSPAGSTGNSTGEQWLDTSLTPAQLKVWNGSAWVGVVADELPVSKLQNGSAYQLIQTDAAGTGVEWTDNIDVPGTLAVTSTATFDSTASFASTATFSSIASHPLGTAAAPTITFTGDTDTGVYSPGVNQVALSSAGTGRLFVAANGNIGVATATPVTALDVNGDLTVTDKVIHSGDTNTSIRFPAADTFTVETGNIERLRVDASGRLGVGTINPSRQLQVENSSGDAVAAIVSGTSSSSFLLLGDTDDDNIGQIVYSNTDNALFVETNGSERLRITSTGQLSHIGGGSTVSPAVGFNGSAPSNSLVIDSTGKLGVGTASPDALFTVAGIGAFDGGSAATPGVTFTGDLDTGVYSPGANQLAISTNGTGRLFVDSQGNLGVGTSNPSARIEAVSNTVPQIKFGMANDADRGSLMHNGSHFYYDTTAGDHVFRSAGFAERLRIDSSGNVGIGVSSLSSSSRLTLLESAGNGQTLEIKGANTGGVGSQPGIKFTASTGDNIGGIFGDTNSDSVILQSGGTERMRIDSSGKVGIGTTSPNAALTVHGSAGNAKIRLGQGGDHTIIGPNASGHTVINAGTSGGNMQFQTAGSERMQIDSSGRLLVGTSSNLYNNAYLQIGGTNSSNYIAQINTSASDADGGRWSQVHWIGTQSGGERSSLAAIQAAHDGGSDDQKGQLQFLINDGNDGNSPTERMRIDSSGTVGIGCVPSSFQSGFDALQIGGNLVLNVDSTGVGAGVYMGNNVYRDSGNSRWEYINTDEATQYYQANGEHVWRSAASGSANAAITWLERMRIDSSGKVGIGTTSPGAVLHVAATGTSTDSVILIAGTNTNGDPSCQARIGATQDGALTSGALTFSTRLSGTTSEKARIDSSGRLLVGTSSAIGNGADNRDTITAVATAGGGLLLGRNDTSTGDGNNLGKIEFWGNDSNGTYEECASIIAEADGTHGTGDKPTRITFSTTADGAPSPTERMRITSGGSIQTFDSSANGFNVRSSSAAGTAANLMVGWHSATNTTNGTYCYIVYSNGNVVNTNDSYGAISDIKLKENIVDAESQWDDFKAVRFRKYNFKKETGHETFTQLGVIAQEIELVSPGLVTDSPDLDEDGNDLGTTTKGVKYSILTKKALVALQEAMERIETLEQRLSDAGIA